MEVTRNIAYRSKGHDRLPSGSHCLDIVRPEGVCDGEMVVFIHGGGWLTGDKGDIFTNPTVPEFFARNGKIFVSVNFRLAQMSSSHVLYQEQADDIASALAWLCENAARFGADGRKITLFGFSSGAHLASLIALDERYLGRHRLDTGIIKSVVAADVHAYDIPAVIRLMRDSSFSERIQLLTRLFGKARRDQLDASPINYVTNPVKKRFLLISVGMKERRNQPFTKEISRSFKSRLETCRHQAAHYHLENRSHESLLRQFGAPGDRFQSILLRFLEAQDNVTDSTTEETTEETAASPASPTKPEPLIHAMARGRAGRRRSGKQEEYKRKAVERAVAPGGSASQVATLLGVSVTRIYEWISELQPETPPEPEREPQPDVTGQPGPTQASPTSRRPPVRVDSGRRISRKVVDQAVSDVRSGTRKPAEIARELGVGVNAVYKWVEQFG